MSTVHNPVNFVPTDYEVVDYLDNHPPVFMEYFPMGMSPAEAEAAREAFLRVRKAWEASWSKYFGLVNDDYPAVQRNCHHCGQHIRYAVVCSHTPTGDYIVVGTECADNRLDMTLDQFKVKFLKEVAAKRAATLKAGSKLEALRQEHPEVFAVFEANRALSGTNQYNAFIGDVWYRVEKKAVLTEKQIAAVLRAGERQACYQAKREEWRKESAAAAPVPVVKDRVQVTGEVLSCREKDTDFGWVWKMTVKCEGGYKLYGSVPSDLDPEGLVGKTVKFMARIAPSRDDPAFGFWSRPTQADIVE